MDELKRHLGAARGGAGPSALQDNSPAMRLVMSWRGIHARLEHRILPAQTSVIRVQGMDGLYEMEIPDHEGMADTEIPTFISTQEGHSPTQGSDDSYRLTCDFINRIVFGENEFGTNPKPGPHFFSLVVL
jgi:hypothetical protein